MKILLVFVVWDFIVRRINGVYVYHGDLVSNPDYSGEIRVWLIFFEFKNLKRKFLFDKS